MKKLLFFLLFIPVFTYSQEPSKDDTKITVTAADTANLFNRICLAMLDKGYSIESKDATLKFVSSTEKTLGSRSIKIRAIIKDSLIVFTGQVASNSTFTIYGMKNERVFKELHYIKTKESSINKIWNEFDSFAKSFGKKIKYSK